MKRLLGIILCLAFGMFCIVNLIQAFASSDGFHYFSDRPHRLLLVAIIGIVGGLIALAFSALSRRLRRRLKLVALALVGSLVVLAGLYFGLKFVSLPLEFRSAIPPRDVLTLLVCTVFIAGLLWFEFFQTLRSREYVA